MPPPLQNNVTNEGEEEEEGQFEDTNTDINLLGYLLNEGFVIEEEYSNFEYYDAKVFQTEDYLNLELTADIYQFDPKKTLNLRLRPKQVAQNPRKKAVIPTKESSSPALENR